MASVRISDKLINEVRDVIKNMRQSETNRLGVVAPNINVHPHDERILSRYLRDHERDAYRIVPREWLEQHDTMSLQLSFFINPDDAEPKETRAELTLVPPTTLKFYLPKDRYSKYSGTSRLEARYADGKWPECDTYVAHVRAAHEIRVRWDKVATDVVGFLRQYPSLNAAVKAWPGVKLYIPKPYLDALERKVERSKVDVAIPAINLDELTAAAVAHRMGV